MLTMGLLHPSRSTQEAYRDLDGTPPAQFSGCVRQSGPDPFTENSKTLNPKLKGRDIREAFKTDEYQLLLVANKFQTGFDEALQ